MRHEIHISRHCVRVPQGRVELLLRAQTTAAINAANVLKTYFLSFKPWQRVRFLAVPRSRRGCAATRFAGLRVKVALRFCNIPSILLGTGC
jgi:hypothetical protein